jgi:lysyl-tRNA synthetase class 2
MRMFLSKIKWLAPWYNFLCVYLLFPAMAKPVFTTKSSTIHRVDYNEKEKMMEIEFRTGNVYRYYNVPPRMWKIFQLYIECEGSAGSFFNEYIKNQFTSEKMSGKEENE